MKQLSVLINGGGMVGASAALALAQHGANVTLLEPFPPGKTAVQTLIGIYAYRL